MDQAPRAELEAMLESVDLTPDDLFRDVPARFRRPLEIPPGLSDLEVEEEVRSELSRNVAMHQRPALLGGGAYAHWIPPEARYLATRGEFLTSYTPYQAEINQGLLQALFEFQTLTTRLLELDVANTGVYDGASGAGEAALMALRCSRGKRVLVPAHIPRQRRSIIENYVVGAGGTVEVVPTDPASGTIDLAALEPLLGPEVACVHVENPNAYGCFEPLAELGRLTEAKGVLLTCMVPEPTSLGLVHGPGHHGAAIAAAEGQSFALPPSFGGPALGLFATREDLLRKMPGRIVGRTKDAEGAPAYCLTLQTREQHIRRARATSNICTNQSFLAVLMAVSLATFGDAGLKRLAATNAAKGRLLRERLEAAGAVVHHRATPHYNEVLFEPPGELDTFVADARSRHVDPGIPARKLFGGDHAGLVACVTELTPDWAIEAVAAACEEAA